MHQPGYKEPDLGNSTSAPSAASVSLLGFLRSIRYEETSLGIVRCALEQIPTELAPTCRVLRPTLLTYTTVWDLTPLYPFARSWCDSVEGLYALSKAELMAMCKAAQVTPFQFAALAKALPKLKDATPPTMDGEGTLLESSAAALAAADSAPRSSGIGTPDTPSSSSAFMLPDSGHHRILVLPAARGGVGPVASTAAPKGIGQREVYCERCGPTAFHHACKVLEQQEEIRRNGRRVRTFTSAAAAELQGSQASRSTLTPSASTASLPQHSPSPLKPELDEEMSMAERSRLRGDRYLDWRSGRERSRLRGNDLARLEFKELVHLSAAGESGGAEPVLQVPDPFDPRHSNGLDMGRTEFADLLDDYVEMIQEPIKGTATGKEKGKDSQHQRPAIAGFTRKSSASYVNGSRTGAPPDVASTVGPKPQRAPQSGPTTNTRPLSFSEELAEGELHAVIPPKPKVTVAGLDRFLSRFQVRSAGLKIDLWRQLVTWHQLQKSKSKGKKKRPSSKTRKVKDGKLSALTSDNEKSSRASSPENGTVKKKKASLKKRKAEKPIFFLDPEFVVDSFFTSVSAHQLLLQVFRRYITSCPWLWVVEDIRSLRFQRRGGGGGGSGGSGLSRSISTAAGHTKGAAAEVESRDLFSGGPYPGLEEQYLEQFFQRSGLVVLTFEDFAKWVKECPYFLPTPSPIQPSPPMPRGGNGMAASGRLPSAEADGPVSSSLREPVHWTLIFLQHWAELLTVRTTPPSNPLSPTGLTSPNGGGKVLFPTKPKKAPSPKSKKAAGSQKS
jgi:hypothetical protein